MTTTLKTIVFGGSAALLLSLAATTSAEVRLPRLISDNMVLQRDTPVTVWGWADAEESVTINFQGKDYQAETGEDERWEVTLPELSAGGPYTLTVSGENEIVVNDVLVGDVWVASGQSNMELNMARTKPLYGEEIANAHFPDIRYFYVPNRYDFKEPKQDLEGGEWQPISTDNIESIATVAYFFALDLHQRYDVPIGIMNASLGGSPAEAWMSEEALKQFPEHLKEGRRFQDDELIESISESDQTRAENWRAERDQKDKGYDAKNNRWLWADPELDHSDWKTTELPGYWQDEGADPINGVWWLRKTIEVPEEWAGKPAMLNLGRLVDADVAFLNGERVGETGYQYPPRWYRLPEGVLQAGPNTIAVRLTSEQGRAGFVPDKDYVLEWGDERIELSGEWHYRLGAEMEALAGPTFIRWKPMGLFNGMLAPLTDYTIKGVIWYQGESNVGRADEYADIFQTMISDWRNKWDRDDLPFLYVQLANYLEAQDEPGDSAWARLREAQLETLELPHTGMAVTIDVGEWNDIHPLNKKAVGGRLAAAARVVAYDEKKAVGSGPLFKSMKVRGKRATLSFESIGSGLVSCDGEPLQEFAIAGEDGEFVWAKAEITGKKRVRVWRDEVSKPKAVRYAWADNPEDANLCNREGLPASPFRTDSWPAVD